MRIINVYAENCLFEVDVGNPIVSNIIVIERAKSARWHDGLGNLQGYFLMISTLQLWFSKGLEVRVISRIDISAVGIQQIGVKVWNLTVDSWDSRVCGCTFLEGEGKYEINDAHDHFQQSQILRRYSTGDDECGTE